MKTLTLVSVLSLFQWSPLRNNLPTNGGDRGSAAGNWCSKTHATRRLDRPRLAGRCRPRDPLRDRRSALSLHALA